MAIVSIGSILTSLKTTLRSYCKNIGAIATVPAQLANDYTVYSWTTSNVFGGVTRINTSANTTTISQNYYTYSNSSGTGITTGFVTHAATSLAVSGVTQSTATNQEVYSVSGYVKVNSTSILNTYNRLV